MIKTTITTIFLTLSLNISASSFGTLPSAYFGADKKLSCDGKHNCNLPSLGDLQSIAEEFLSYSNNRINSLDIIESEILYGIQTYNHAIEDLFTTSGNPKLKTFLETGLKYYTRLLDDLRISSSRQLVGGNSLFLSELMQMEDILKDTKNDIINAKNKKQIKILKKKNLENYIIFRNSGKFSAYKYIEQIKINIDSYEKNNNLSAWFSKESTAIKLNFKDCPKSIKKQINQLHPSIQYEINRMPMQFDFKNYPKMVRTLIENGQVMTVNCVKRVSGEVRKLLNTRNSSITIEYKGISKSKFILPELK